MRKKKRTDIPSNKSLYLDKEKKDWLKENNIKRYSVFTNHKGKKIISFAYEEDAMAYKLQWL